MEDVIALPTFRCKICSYRLQSPVLKVGNFGNICVRCYERNAYTDVTENSEIEIILSKLDVPCNFAEGGCTYLGPYYKTCDHEKKCCFRKRLCPFSHFSQCGFEFVKKTDALHHIRRNHQKSVLKVENGCICVENPTAYDPHAIYLLEIDKMSILLRMKLKPEKELLYYAFYHFGDLQGKSIYFFSNAFEKYKKNNRIIHESEITPKFDKSNAFQAKVSTLKHLGYFKEINISVSFDKTITGDGCLRVPVGNDLWISCLKCNKFVNAVWYCSLCRNRECESCKNDELAIVSACPHSSNGIHLLFYFDLGNPEITRRIPCENKGCNQMLKGNADVYRIHYDYQCSFKKHECFLGNCKFKDLTHKFIEHMFNNHQRENTKRFPLQCDIACKRLFTNGNDTFLHKYFLTKEKELKLECVKLTEPFWDDSCIWIVNVIFKSGHPVTVRGDYTLEGFTRKLPVGEYMNENLLLLETHVKRI